MQSDVYPAGVISDYERDDIELVSHAGGRLWELRRPGGPELIATEPDGGGAQFAIDIFVGRVAGELKVVR